MLKILALLINAAHAQVAILPPNPNNYLVLPDLPTAQARSQQQCQALGCSGVTVYWWRVVPLTDGTAAVEIQPSGAFSATTTVGPCAVCGLSGGEQLQLQTATQLGTKLPSVNAGSLSLQP